MRIELAERLRCPAAHAPTPLIVVARRVEERELVEGFAGCMTCHLEARVEHGVVSIDAPYDVAITGAPTDDAAREPATEDMITRAAALLGLAEPGGAVLLAGRYGVLAATLRERFDVMTAMIDTTGAVPFADATFRGAALDLPGIALDDALRTLVAGGRLLAPASAVLPAGARELARDDVDWVAEREATGPVVTLGRASPPHTTSR